MIITNYNTASQILSPLDNLPLKRTDYYWKFVRKSEINVNKMVHSFKIWNILQEPLHVWLQMRKIHFKTIEKNVLSEKNMWKEWWLFQ